MEEAIYTPEKLRSTLDAIVHNDVRLSLMLWGPPGIGKSSIVAQVAQAHDLDLIDLRLSQLAPTDLRGLPVAEHGDQGCVLSPQRSVRRGVGDRCRYELRG